MALDFPRLPFPIDPLIAEARRRRRRRLVLLAAAVVVVAAAAAGGEILASGSSYVASRPIQSALARYVGACGESGGLSYGGCYLSFHPGETFALSVVVTNKAGVPITLEGARVMLARVSPLRQIGTRLASYTYEPAYPAECLVHSCPRIAVTGQPDGSAPIFPPPYGPAHPVPLSVSPGHQAFAQLNLRFVSCWNHPIPWRPILRHITVLYRASDGVRISQRLRLGEGAVQVIGSSACRS